MFFVDCGYLLNNVIKSKIFYFFVEVIKKIVEEEVGFV